MKKYIGFIILAGLLLSSSLAKADDNNGSEGSDNNSGKSEFKDQLQAKRDAFKSEMEAKREAFKLEMDKFKEGLKTDKETFQKEVEAMKADFQKEKKDKKVEFCGKATEMVNNKFPEVITKLEEFQVKAGDAITKLQAEGKDTTLATESLNLSKTNLAAAKAKILEVKALIPANCGDITPDLFAKIKLGARDAKDLLKQTRENLHQVIKEIKVLRGEDKNSEDNKDANKLENN